MCLCRISGTGTIHFTGKCGFSQSWEVLRPFHGAVLKIFEAALHPPKKAIYAKFCATTIAFEDGICYYI
jgi:hypothetical protein